jgi:hypothetical protein
MSFRTFDQGSSSGFGAAASGFCAGAAPPWFAAAGCIVCAAKGASNGATVLSPKMAAGFFFQAAQTNGRWDT